MINTLTESVLLVDVWNGPQGNPIIYHGHTLTSKIQLDDVLKAVNEHAFVCTP